MPHSPNPKGATIGGTGAIDTRHYEEPLDYERSHPVQSSMSLFNSPPLHQMRFIDRIAQSAERG